MVTGNKLKVGFEGGLLSKCIGGYFHFERLMVVNVKMRMVIDWVISVKTVVFMVGIP